MKKCKTNVPQTVKAILGDAKHAPSVWIDGRPVHNLAGLKIETVGDDVNEAIITMKIIVAADFIKFKVEQR